MTRSTPCPDSGMLLRYWSGRVAEPQATTIRQHLAGCHECAELLATAGDSPETTLQGLQGTISRPTPFRSASAAATLTPSGRLTFDFLARPSSPANDATPPPSGPGLTSLTGGTGDRSGSGVRPSHGSAVSTGIRAERGSDSRPVHDALPRFDNFVDNRDPIREEIEVTRLTPSSGPGLPSMMYLGQCPNCGDMLRDLGGQGWCLTCGYTTTSHSPGLSRGPSVSLWFLVPALLGCAGVVGATALRDSFLPPGSFMQIWWIGVEALFGILLYMFAHAWIVAVTFRHWPEGEMFKYIDPMTVMKYAFSHLKKTRIPISLATWGGTAFICAFILFWMNNFAFKDKTKKPRPTPMPVSQSRGFENKTEEEVEAEEYMPPEPLVAPEESSPSDVALIDLSGSQDPERQPPPPRTTECVVIGYVPDPDDPNKIDQLILGTRSEDGTIRYAGTVRHFAKAGEVERGLAQIKGVRPLVNAPSYMPSDLGAIPLEPSLVCRVNFGERDANGLYKNTVLQGVSQLPEGTPGGTNGPN